MPFISSLFIVFFVLFLVIYYFPTKESVRWQNIVTLVGSYLFYSVTHFLLLPFLLFSTVFSFGMSYQIEKNLAKSGVHKQLLLSLFFILGALIYFKFTPVLWAIFVKIGNLPNSNTMSIDHWILPLGISYFSFKQIAYLMEVYHGRFKAHHNFIDYASYIAFFPTIVAGPIDRPAGFLNQLKNYRVFDYSKTVEGCRQILWGAFQKMVIADNLAVYTDYVWMNHTSMTSSTLVLAAILFTFQIYTDFSGYSHIAIGIGKMLQFDININFKYPLFAKNIAEYWRRWHISLTSWFTDYVFLPLNLRFRAYRKKGLFIAILINMMLIGLWHGHNWNYLVFGIYHAILFIPLIYTGKMTRNNANSAPFTYKQKFIHGFKVIKTFSFVTIGMIFFNSKNLGQAIEFIGGIFSSSLAKMPYVSGIKETLFFLVVFMIMEWRFQQHEFAFMGVSKIKSRIIRWLLYALIIFVIGLFMQTVHKPFIYLKY